MDRRAASTAQRVLHALADLSPAAEQRAGALTIPTEWFRWLPINAVRLFMPPARPLIDEGAVLRRLTVSDPRVVSARIDHNLAERLAAVDQIRAGEHSLRAGWLFVAGRAPAEGGRSSTVFHPLVTVPVRVERLTSYLVPAGDVEVSDLVSDRRLREELEATIELGGGALEGETDPEIPPRLLARLDRLQRFARTAAQAAHLPATQVVPVDAGPDALMRASEMVVVAGVGIFALNETGGSSRASSLRAWTAEHLNEPTAFHWLYLDELTDPSPGEEAQENADVHSPYLLTPVQQEAVRSSRRRPLTLVSGAPGTGKSQTVVAVACAALGRGERVLVAAKSDATVDALLDLLEQAPGPDPVVFGSNERRDALAARLAAGQLQPTTDTALVTARARLDATVAERDRLHAQMVDRLRAEQMLATPEDEVATARVVAPSLFDPATDLDVAGALLDRALDETAGWRAGRRARQAAALLREIAGAAPDVTPTELAPVVGVARAARISADLVAGGGLELSAEWEALAAADDSARDALGQWIAAESRSTGHVNRSTLPSVAVLATALRSGRAARRAQLARLEDGKLTRALPLWVGTLADVDDLLPAVPALFDLVILDEASSIDQPLAAVTLLRGRRGVIAGDPHQLRHVSFLSDDRLREVTAAHQLDHVPTLAGRLDVRRNSVFDVAAGVTPVLTLDEQFRSEPHLVDFVARRLYGGRVTVATRMPTTESKDCIRVVRTSGERDRTGVVMAEVDHVISELRALAAAGARSVGVVTPFRAQADALETAALAAFPADALEALDLRIGTVHAFQGNERDVVVASLGIGPTDGPASWRFVGDPHLFTVLVTRARKQLILVVSADPPAGGLVEAYLAQADAPPRPPAPAGPVTPWTSTVADHLTLAGVEVRTAYPTGRHVVDISVAAADRNVGVECEVHPDGPEAHIDRHLALCRAGWELVGAHRSWWVGDGAALIIDVVKAIAGAASATP